MAMRRFAAIDVGSNALRLRIVRWAGGARVETWAPLVRERVALRLGHDVFVRGSVGPKGMDRACDALRRFGRTMASARVDRYRAVATSALREAANGMKLVSSIEKATGIRLEVIDGEEEAALVALAVGRQIQVGDGRVLLVDLGGGSVEFTLLESGTMVGTWSLPLGTVRLLKNESWTSDGSFDGHQRRLLEAHIERALCPVVAAVAEPVSRVVVTGGNARALSVLCPVKGRPERSIDVERMRQLLSHLAPLTPAMRTDALGLRPDRADVIVPAAAVLSRVARAWGVASLGAPRAGLSDGVLHALADECMDSQRRGSGTGARTTMRVIGRRGRGSASYSRHGSPVESRLAR